MKKKLSILGGGESGYGAAVLAMKHGYDVFLSDKGKIAEKYATTLQEYEIAYEEEKHTEDHILNADEIMKSPGIADKYDIIKKIKENCFGERIDPSYGLEGGMQGGHREFLKERNLERENSGVGFSGGEVETVYDLNLHAFSY